MDLSLDRESYRGRTGRGLIGIMIGGDRITVLHAMMRHVGTIWLALFGVFVLYSFMVYRGGTCADGCAPTSAELHGMDLWQRYNCQACHQLYGLGGYMGPDLTDATSCSDPGRLRTFIRYGTGRMPSHDLTDAEVDALVAYLGWVDRSGDAQVPAEAVHWSGTYIIGPRP